MSEEKKTETRTPYEVTVEPMDFTADFSGKFMSSIEFCRLANEFFKAAFADFEGSVFEMSQGMPSLTLYFNHAEKDGVKAVERIASAKFGSTILDRTRARDAQMKDGDRYHITEDGIDIIKPLLQGRYKNTNQGKVNWKNIVSDVVDRTAANMYNNNVVQMTKISGIDPRQICQLIYGSKDENGKYIDYGVEVKADLNMRSGFQAQASSNYVLAITKAYTGNIQSTYEKFGLAGAGSNIVR